MSFTMFKHFIVLQLVNTLCLANEATENGIMRDYFVYKNVRSVVGFSCAHITRQCQLVKTLNDLGISATIKALKDHSNLKAMLSSTFWKVGLFVDSRCSVESTSFILTEAGKYGMYGELHKWLILGADLNALLQPINDDAFGFLTDFVVAEVTGNKSTLYDIYNPHKARGGTLNTTKLGSWTQGEGLTVDLVQEKFPRRANLHGMKLKVTSITQYRPNDTKLEDYLEDYTTRSRDRISKYTYAILRDIADLFNFTMEISEVGMWDKIQPNGSHSGLMGALQRGEADFGGCTAVMTAERLGLGKIIGPAWPFRTCFMFRSTPTKLRNELWRALSPESWYSVLLLSAFTILIFGLVLISESADHWLQICTDASMLTIGSLCQQGSSYIPSRAAGRIAFLHLLVFSLMMYNYYSASIVSARLSEPLDKMNDSLSQLAKSSFGIAAEPIPYTDFLLTTSPDWEVRTFYRKRWANLPDSKRYLPLEEGIKRMSEGNFAYHTDPNNGYPFVEKFFDDKMICELTEVHLFQPTMMALWASYESPLVEMAKVGLAKLTNMGLRVRQVKRWSSRRPHCEAGSLTLKSITIFETAPALIVLLVGSILATGICFMEIIVFNRLKGARESYVKRAKAGGRKIKLNSLRLFDSVPRRG